MRMAKIRTAKIRTSPLFFSKLEKLVALIGKVGMAVALVCFVADCVIGYGIDKKKGAEPAVMYFSNAIAILAVSIPEGLPMALLISLALTSKKMSQRNNLVKTLESCETMGSATTICTDKTGTLTANRMAVRGAYVGGVKFDVDDKNHTLAGPNILNSTEVKPQVKELLCTLISVCTMDESTISRDTDGTTKFSGNPTECALLKLAEDLGTDWGNIRDTTKGRNKQTQSEGRVASFSSSPKMMSWAVPTPGGYRVYAKGASEIILGRVAQTINCEGDVSDVTEAQKKSIAEDIIKPFANKAMRTFGLAYKDMAELPPLGEDTDEAILNPDGSQALIMETNLILVGIMGIEDPLRKEVPPAIDKCYRAGID